MGFMDKLKDTASQAKDAAVNFAEEKQISEKLGSAAGSVKKQRS